uniref:2-phosphoxylose phosphatase 1 isoform X1 n=1 Tax=Myxine glutinosa TaxID=7769 RepID=UPI00358DF5B3
MMGFRSRFVLLLCLAALLAVLSLSLQFLHLLPLPAGLYTSDQGKLRKRVLVDLVIPPSELDAMYESHRYCNRPNHTVQGLEGHVPPGYHLASIVVMIRHGDRYPLSSLPGVSQPDIACDIKPEREPTHHQLATFVQHMRQADLTHLEGALASLPLFPTVRQCETGQLTQTGLVQHIMNGEYLRQAYDNHGGLFADVDPPPHVETTPRSRTLQSAMALLYGLRPMFPWSSMHVRSQASVYYCGTACDCPARGLYLERTEQERALNRAQAPDIFYKALAELLDLSVAQAKSTLSVDPLLALFCHGQQLPCRQRGCLKSASFRLLRQHQLTEERKSKRGAMYQRFALLAMYPMLNRTASHLQRIAEGHLAPRLSLCSGHDTTLEPMLNALGLHDAPFPRYAARLVFELWRKGPGVGRVESHAIRILYDGEDVTSRTSFCRSRPAHEHCPLRVFLDFVSSGMLAPFNTSSYQQACQVLQRAL